MRTRLEAGLHDYWDSLPFHPKECKPPGKGGCTWGLSLLSLRLLVCLARVARRAALR